MNANFTKRTALSLALFLPTLAACSGFGTSGLNVGEPELTVHLTLDREAARIGESVLAVVRVENTGEETVSIPRPGRTTMTFYQRLPESPDPLVVDFVSSPAEPLEFVALGGGESTERQFLLPLATRRAGRTTLFAVYRPEADAAIESAAPVASQAAELSTEGPKAFDRDSNGNISADDAKRVAIAFFARPAVSAEADWQVDSNVELGLWLVTVRFAQPDEKGRTERSCHVTGVTGRVKQLVDDAALEKARRQHAGGAGAPPAPRQGR